MSTIVISKQAREAANEVCNKLCNCGSCISESTLVIQNTINSATAEKDRRIAEVEAANREAVRRLDEQKATQDFYLQERDQLRAQVKEMEDRLHWLNTVEGMDWLSCCNYGEATFQAIDSAMADSKK